MKIAIITDTHHGVRNDHIAFLDNSKQFLNEVFFPYIDNNNIDTIIHLGDIVDRRKYINFNTAKRLREDFIEPIVARNTSFFITAGNHDVYYKNTNSVNALRELIGNYDNIHIYDNVATEIELYGMKIFLIPWICDENREATMKAMEQTNAQIAMGHLQIEGFEMFKGSLASHGDSREIFDKFDMVFSGHFHHRSSDGHIFYLGSHGEFTWADYNDPRGFHVFDTDTRELSFIENPYKMYKIIVYNDAENEDILDTDLSPYKGCIVKVVITEKNNNYTFEKFIEKLERELPVDIVVVDKNLEMMLQDDEDGIVKEAESVIEIFKGYINTIDEKTVDKEKLTDKMIELYEKAIVEE